METARDEIYPLTSLRFVAALYVFLFHIHIRWPLATGAVGNILSQGAVGMSLFFVLSGYVLTHRYAERPASLTSYFTNRVARIYPVYLAAALVTLPWLLTGTDPSNSANLGDLKALARVVILVASDALLIQAWLPQLFSYWNNAGSWSISTEAFFYTLFPALLYVLKRGTKGNLLVVAALAYALCFMPAVALYVFSPQPAPALPIFYAMPIFRLPEFVIGILAYFAGRNLRLHPAAPDTLITGSLVALLVYLAAFPYQPIFVFHNWLVVPVVACLLICLAQGRGYIAAALAARPLVWLGKVSYCFYSFQVLILLILISYHEQICAAVPVMSNNYVLLVASFAILLLLSALGYHLLEEPARKRLRNFSLEQLAQVRVRAPVRIRAAK